MRIIVTAGGTGGHIYPALSIIKEFEKHEKNVEVIYIGTHNRMEKDIVPEMGYKYIPLEIYGFSKSIIKIIKNIVLIKKSYNQSLKLMKEFKPDVVIGTGGYVTYPVLKAATKLKVTTFIHEQNSIPGKTNKALSKKVDLVGVSFKSSISEFSNRDNVFYSGNPCFSQAKEAEVIEKTSLGFSENKKLIIIVAGSLGSGSINNKLKEFLESVNNYEVLYITGKTHYESFLKDFNINENVKVVPYLNNLPGLMKDADLIISRAGASTSSEILALQIPSILIPSPYVANNHQYYNALDLQKMGVSILIEEKDLTIKNLNENIQKILNNEKNYKNIIKNFSNYESVDSANLIYKKIKETFNDK